MELKFILLEEHHTSNSPSHREQVNLAALNPNTSAASNCHNGKSKPKDGSKFDTQKKARPTNSSCDG